jgi:hypothetical protein
MGFDFLSNAFVSNRMKSKNLVKMSGAHALATLLLCACAGAQSTTMFTVSSGGEAVAEIPASAPGAAWDKPDAEASVATLAIDGVYNQDVLLYMGAQPWIYRVFLGPVTAGQHRLTLTRNPQWSAAGAGFELRQVQVRTLPASDPEYTAVAHAPVLYARADTLGHFSDAPLLMYYERLPGDVLQYSVIFTNEDGGTPSDALMARWGRGTDIEYVYRVTLDAAGNMRDEVFQANDHKEMRFRGKKVGTHPLILVATMNNVFADTGYSAVQYRMLPTRVDLTAATRESVMDQNPWTYRVMAQELAHEGKLREFGTEKPPAIGDPRQYLSLELNLEIHGSAGVAAWAKRKDNARWYSSHRGRLDFTVARNGWIRTTVELPPGTQAADIEAIAVECLDVRDPRVPASGPAPECGVQPGKAFLLGQDYMPGANLVQSSLPVRLRPGEKITLTLAH